MQDFAVPLVSSPMGLERFEEFGFARDAPYFNAGVFLMDTSAWRQQRIGPRAIEYLERYRDSINLLDQDALNAVMGTRWKQLDYRWNVIAGLAARTFHRQKELDAAQLSDAIDRPGILALSEPRGSIRRILPKIEVRSCDRSSGSPPLPPSADPT